VLAPEISPHSFVSRRLAALGARMGRHADVAAALDVPGGTRETLARLGLVDLSPLPRIGFKGRGTIPAMQATGLSVEAEPNPPRAPEVSVVLPGEITRRLVPSSLIWSCTCALAPRPSPTVSTTAVMPIRIPSIVSAERSLCVRTASVAVRSVSSQVTVPPPPERGRARTPGARCGRHGSGSCAERAPRCRARG